MSHHPICLSPHCCWNISSLQEPTTSAVSFLVFHHANLFRMMMCSLEGFFMNHLSMVTFSRHSHPAVCHCLPFTGVSAECETATSSITSNHCPQQAEQTNSMLRQLISAASCTVKVLLKCHPTLHLFNGLQYNQPFVRALVGSIRVRISLPPFSEFLKRFDAAANVFYRQYNVHEWQLPPQVV